MDVGQPIVSLSWSLSYDKLAIGTEKGSILFVDPMKLKECGSILVSGHHYCDVVGIDVLGSGLECCVVSDRLKYTVATVYNYGEIVSAIVS